MKLVSLEAVEKCFDDMYMLCGQNETEWNEFVSDFWDRFYIETNS